MINIAWTNITVDQQAELFEVGWSILPINFDIASIRSISVTADFIQNTPIVDVRVDELEKINAVDVCVNELEQINSVNVVL